MANYTHCYLDFGSDADADTVRNFLYNDKSNALEFERLLDIPAQLQDLDLLTKDVNRILYGFLMSTDSSLTTLQNIVATHYFDDPSVRDEHTLLEVFGTYSKEEWNKLLPKQQDDNLVMGAKIAHAIQAFGVTHKQALISKELESLTWAEAEDIAHTSWMISTKWVLPTKPLIALAKKFPNIPFRSYGYEGGMCLAYDMSYDGAGTIDIIETSEMKSRDDYVNIVAKVLGDDDIKYVDGYFVNPWDFDDYEDVVAKYPTFEDIPDTDFEEDPCWTSPNAEKIII